MTYRPCLLFLCSWFALATSKAHASAPPPSSEAAASADPDADARRHFEAGREHFEGARYSEAYTEFEEAYRLSQRPELLLNMSRSLEAALEPARAIAVLDVWLGIAPVDSTDRDLVETRRRRLVAQLERQRAESPRAPEQAAEPQEPSAPPVPELTATRRPAWVGYGLLGAGVALGTAGSALWVVGSKNIARVEDPPAGSTWDDLSADHERGPRRVVLGIALSGVALASLTVGVLWLVLPQKREALRSSALDLVSGRF